MKTKILNLDNKAAGDVELNDAIFGLEPRQDLIQRVVVWQLAKRRSGQHKVLTRGEINRTKKKLGKQKGGGTGPSRRPFGSAVRRRRQGHGPGHRTATSSTCPRRSRRWACATRCRPRPRPARSSFSTKPSPRTSRPAPWPSSSAR